MKNYIGIKALATKYAVKCSVKENMTIKSAEVQVRGVLELLGEVLLDPSYDGVQVIDFITLQRKLRKSRVGRNPRTKEVIQVPEKMDIKCILGKKFEDKLNS